MEILRILSYGVSYSLINIYPSKGRRKLKHLNIYKNMINNILEIGPSLSPGNRQH